MKRLEAEATAQMQARPTEPDAAAEMTRLALIAAGFIALSSVLFLFAFYEWEHALYLLRWAALLTIAPLLLVALVFMAAIVEAGAEKLTARDLSDSVEVGDIRPIPVYSGGKPERTIGGCAVSDITEFVRGVAATGDASQDFWRGRVMPSGLECKDKYWKMLLAVVATTGRLVPGGPRQKAKLLDFEADAVLEQLGILMEDG